MSPDRARLRLPVRRILEEGTTEQELDQLWEATRRHRLDRRRYRSLGWGLAAAACLLLGVGVILGRGSLGATDNDPLYLADGRMPHDLSVRPEGQGRRATLSDGSFLLVGPSTNLETTANDGETFGLRLLAGQVDVFVRPGGPRRWHVDAGLATVRVIGTRFVVERTEHRVEVRVSRGVVTVREHTGGVVHSLEAGESVVVGTPPPRAQAQPSVPIRSAPDPAEANERLARRPVATPRAAFRGAVRRDHPVSEPSRDAPWRVLREAGDYQGAFESLGEARFRRSLPGASAPLLLELSDLARRSGRPRLAVHALEQLLREHGGTSDAPLAAFTLGRIYADTLNDDVRAAEVFERAGRLGLPAALQSEALARQAMARSQAGHGELASEAAAAYLDRYPAGNRADAMRNLLGDE